MINILNERRKYKDLKNITNSEKELYVLNKSSKLNMFVANPVRSCFALCGILSAGIPLVASMFPHMNQPSGFMAGSLLMATGVAAGNLRSKINFHSMNSKPISFVRNSIAIGVGAITYFLSSKYQIYDAVARTSVPMSLINAINFVGGVMLGQGVTNIVSGLRWNEVHKEYNENYGRFLNNDLRKIDAKFEMYYNKREVYLEKNMDEIAAENLIKETKTNTEKKQKKNYSVNQDFKENISEIEEINNKSQKYFDTVEQRNNVENNYEPSSVADRVISVKNKVYEQDRIKENINKEKILALSKKLKEDMAHKRLSQEEIQERLDEIKELNQKLTSKPKKLRK